MGALRFFFLDAERSYEIAMSMFLLFLRLHLQSAYLYISLDEGFIWLLQCNDREPFSPCTPLSTLPNVIWV